MEPVTNKLTDVKLRELHNVKPSVRYKKTKTKKDPVTTASTVPVIVNSNVALPPDVAIDIDLGVNGQVSNNWTEPNKKTLRDWKASLAKATFIYQYILEGAKKKLNRILVIVMLIGGLSTILSGVSAMVLLNDTPEYKRAALVVSAITFVLGVLITMLTSAIKIYKIDDTVSSSSTYIEKIDQIQSEISNTLVLPDALKEDAIDFITRENKDYLNLIKQSPDIDLSTEQEALLQYNQYLQAEGLSFKLSQKYGSDSMIDVV